MVELRKHKGNYKESARRPDYFTKYSRLFKMHPKAMILHLDASVNMLRPKF